MGNETYANPEIHSKLATVSVVRVESFRKEGKKERRKERKKEVFAELSARRKSALFHFFFFVVQIVFIKWDVPALGHQGPGVP